MKIKDIYSFIDTLAPFSSAEEWDNVGLLIGDMDGDIERAVVALDCTPDALQTAIELNAGLIITHHPVIFSPVNRLDSNSIPWKLARHNISVISAHTNLDKAEKGVNTRLGEVLGLKATPSANDPFLQIAETDGCVLEDFLGRVKATLGCEALRVYKAHDLIGKIGFCCGSGGDSLENAFEAGCDTFLCGDIKHNVFVKAAELGITLIDAGHFATENIIIEPMTEMLKARFPEVDFITCHTKPFCVF